MTARDLNSCVRSDAPLESVLAQVPAGYELTAACDGFRAWARIRHIGFAGKIYDGAGSSWEEAITAAVRAFLDAKAGRV